MRRALKRILAGLLAVSLTLSGLFLLGLTPRNDRELRMPARSLLRAIDSRDYGSEIENAGNEGRIWAIRASADNKPLGEALIWTAQYILDLPEILSASLSESQQEAYYKTGSSFLRTEAQQPSLSRLAEAGGVGLMATLRHDFNELASCQPQSKLSGATEHWLAEYTPLRKGFFSRESSVKPEIKALPVIPRGERMNYYRSLVENFSKRYNLNINLVMAIIHSESDFSPSLVSNKSAMGLMQLLPSTASDEVHRFLYGKRGQIGFEDLRNPEINIRYGTAYLHILLNRYFAHVRNRDVQEVCAIAAYNLGPNRFLRLYGPTNEQAEEAINKMSEEEFYEDLIRRLPARETRFFVQKVRRMKNHYSSLP